MTSSNNFHFIDNRSADPNLAGVRQLKFIEILDISGFAPDMNATAFLHSRTEDDALRDVAAAVPPPTLFHLYRAIVHHASAAFLSLRVCSGLEDVYIIDMLPEHDLPCVDDDEFALLAADVVTQAAHCPASSSEEALPSMLRLGTTLTEGLHVSTLGSASSPHLSSSDAVRATGGDRDGGAAPAKRRKRNPTPTPPGSDTSQPSLHRWFPTREPGPAASPRAADEHTEQEPADLPDR